MIKVKFFLFLIFFLQTLRVVPAQESKLNNFVAYYSYKINNSIEYKSKLIHQENHSLFYVNYDDKSDLSTDEQIRGQGIYYKDFENKEIVFKGIFSPKKRPIWVQDSLHIFDWKILPELDSVGGYPCQKATLNFRGRQYGSCFSTELSSNDGPYKFNNLPGLILKIESKDQYLSIVMEKIVFNSSNFQLLSTFCSKKDSILSNAMDYEMYQNKIRIGLRKNREIEKKESEKKGLPYIPTIFSVIEQTLVEEHNKVANEIKNHILKLND